MRQILPIVEKVQVAIRDKKELTFFIPSSRVSGLYKDMWAARTALKWGGLVRFSKKSDGLEIHIRPEVYSIVEVVEVPLEVQVAPTSYYTIEGMFPLNELVAKLTAAYKEHPAIKLSLSHLTVLERERMDKLINHLGLESSTKDHWTLLRKR